MYELTSVREFLMLLLNPHQKKYFDTSTNKEIPFVSTTHIYMYVFVCIKYSWSTTWPYSNLMVTFQVGFTCMKGGKKVYMKNGCVLIWRSPIGSGVRPHGTLGILNSLGVNRVWTFIKGKLLHLLTRYFIQVLSECPTLTI